MIIDPNLTAASERPIFWAAASLCEHRWFPYWQETVPPLQVCVFCGAVTL